MVAGDNGCQVTPPPIGGIPKVNDFFILFNPESDVFSLTLDSELIENERFFVSDLKASCRNQGDSISLFVTAADLFAKGMYMPDFSVIGGAKENRINLAARFNNSDNGTYAL